MRDGGNAVTNDAKSATTRSLLRDLHQSTKDDKTPADEGLRAFAVESKNAYCFFRVKGNMNSESATVSSSPSGSLRVSSVSLTNS